MSLDLLGPYKDQNDLDYDIFLIFTRDYFQILKWCHIVIDVHYVKMYFKYTYLSLHSLCGGGDLLFSLSPPATTATFCFCSYSKTLTQIISKYLQCAYWPWGICLVIFFFAFSSFFNEIASSICFMFRLMERPYPGRELKSFWCDTDNTNFDFCYVLVF